MEKPIITISGLGKRYNIQHQRGRYIALRDVIAGIFKNPFRFVREKSQAVIGGKTKEDFWALQDISLDIYRGEVIGIIGSNGAGKSTLLKILSQITPPTTGEIRIHGRVGSLLEVGTGFHPELTGRENIILNGAILGMPYKEIATKFDQIVEFSGVEKFLDTPVKYYSSGMYVRLAFSVAAHMDPDILIIDEVLAVGDAEFQKKCLGKMEEVTKTQGRTILFVSHNMAAIQRLCKKTVYLKNGHIEMYGDTEKVVSHYLEKGQAEAEIVITSHKNSDVQINKITFLDGQIPCSNIPIHKNLTIQVDYTVVRPLQSATLRLTFSAEGQILLNSYESDRLGKFTDYSPGMYSTRVTIPSFTFNIGNYELDVSIQNPGIAFIDRVQNINFRVVDGENPKTKVMADNVLGSMGTILEYVTRDTQK